jgi:polar amino acid transport system permease protein
MWNWDYAISIIPKLMVGLKITVYATIIGFVIASLVGLLLAILRRSRQRIVLLLTGGFIEFIRSTPLLAQLYFLFYGLPYIGISLPPLVAGIIGLGFHYSTYLSEVYRAGIDSIPRSQWEAATVMSFSKRYTWLRIILPQAIPPILPVMGNYFIAMFKETPLLAAITVVELLLTARIIGTATFRFIEPFTIVGVMFLILSYISSLILQKIELKLKTRQI